MYRYVDNRNLVDCAIIKVESENDYYYKVNVEEIMEKSLFIKELFDKYNIPHNRIYLMGFSLVTKGEIWSDERIFDHISKIANSINAQGIKVGKR